MRITNTVILSNKCTGNVEIMPDLVTNIKKVTFFYNPKVKNQVFC